MAELTADELGTETRAGATDLVVIYPPGGPLKGMTFANLTASLAPAQGSLLFGDGSDGNVGITTPVTLARDMYYNNLTIAAGANLNPNGFRIFVAGTLDLTACPANGISTIQAGGTGSGQNAASTAAGGVGGVAPGTGTIGATAAENAGLPGYAGLTGQGTPGAHNTSGAQINGGSVGSTGASGLGSAAAGQPAVAPGLTSAYRWPGLYPFLATQSTPIAFNFGIVGGVGGSAAASGTGDGVNRGGASGGGGAGGGVIFIAARFVKRSGCAANGINLSGRPAGLGFAPVTGNCGGAGGSTGGGGGWLLFVIGDFVAGDAAATNAINIQGNNGAPGTAAVGTGVAGDGGASGQGGAATIALLSANTITTTKGSAAVAGAAHVGAAPGAGGVAVVDQVTL